MTLIVPGVSKALGDGSVGRRHLMPSARDIWLPAGAIAQNMPWGIPPVATLTLLSTGRLGVVGGITLPAGVPVSSITFASGSTALVTGTHQWFALYDVATRALLRQTVNDGATAWAATTRKTLALTSSYTPSVDTPVWVGIMVAAATVPTLTGIATQSSLNGLTPLLGGISNTGLTGAAPDPCNAPTGFGSWPYCYVS
jgi:hypothetical protein